MSDNLKAHLALLATNVIYGANYAIAKLAMPEYLKPSGFILIRVSVALLMYILLQKFFVRHEKIMRNDFKKFFLCGMFGVAINQLLFFKGLSLTAPVDASLIMTSNPILVLLVAWLMIGEKITSRKISGIALGIAGAVTLILIQPKTSDRASNMLGDSLIILNALSYAIYLVMVKPLMMRYHPLTVIKWTFVFGTLLVIPFGFNEAVSVNWGGLPGFVWWVILYVVIGATFLAYLFNMYALKTISPSVVSFYIYVQPVIAAIGSLILTHERIKSEQIIASLLIFAGVYLVSTPFVVRENS